MLYRTPSQSGAWDLSTYYRQGRCAREPVEVSITLARLDATVELTAQDTLLLLCGPLAERSSSQFSTLNPQPAHAQTIDVMMLLETPYPKNETVVVLNQTAQLVDDSLKSTPLSEVRAMYFSGQCTPRLVLVSVFCCSHAFHCHSGVRRAFRQTLCEGHATASYSYA